MKIKNFTKTMMKPGDVLRLRASINGTTQSMDVRLIEVLPQNLFARDVETNRVAFVFQPRDIETIRVISSVVLGELNGRTDGHPHRLDRYT